MDYCCVSWSLSVNVDTFQTRIVHLVNCGHSYRNKRGMKQDSDAQSEPSKCNLSKSLSSDLMVSFWSWLVLTNGFCFLSCPHLCLLVLWWYRDVCWEAGNHDAPDEGFRCSTHEQLPDGRVRRRFVSLIFSLISLLTTLNISSLLL